jgi:hypothetical protein
MTADGAQVKKAVNDKRHAASASQAAAERCALFEAAVTHRGEIWWYTAG